jgi:type II secretory pathway component GspD/PulD (secretin)
MKTSATLATTLLAIMIAACNRGPELDTRTFELQYLDAYTAASLIEPYVYGDREGAPGTISTAGDMASHLITVRETPDNLAKIERVLSEYDQPAPMVQLHFQVIEANGNTTPDSAIAGVESALRRLFRFRGYRLLSEAVLSGVTRSSMTQNLGGEGPVWGIKVNILDVRGGADSGTVRFEVSLYGPTGEVFETTANVRLGQTMVLGSTKPRASRETLILAVRPEVMKQ